MRNLAHQRRRHPCARPVRSRGDRPRALRRRGRGRAGERPVRRRPFAFAQRPFEATRGQPPAFRHQGHADRLRHHGRAQDHGRPAAGPRAVGGQPGPERRRGRDLFRHDRRRDGGGDARHSLDRAVAGLWRRAGQGDDRMGRGGSACRAADFARSSRPAFPAAASSMSIFHPARRTRSRESPSPARASATPS